MAISAPPQSGPSFRPPRILLVDDDLMVLRALRRLLQGARPGWEIDAAENADSALELVAKRTYDAVVTDLHMPALDGIGLLMRLKAERPEVMRVIHSSHVESLTSEQRQELAHAVLSKPGRPEELVNVLDWALSHRKRKLCSSGDC